MALYWFVFKGNIETGWFDHGDYAAITNVKFYNIYDHSDGKLSKDLTYFPNEGTYKVNTGVGYVMATEGGREQQMYMKFGDSKRTGLKNFYRSYSKINDDPDADHFPGDIGKLLPKGSYGYTPATGDLPLLYERVRTNDISFQIVSNWGPNAYPKEYSIDSSTIYFVFQVDYHYAPSTGYLYNGNKITAATSCQIDGTSSVVLRIAAQTEYVYRN